MNVTQPEEFRMLMETALSLHDFIYGRPVHHGHLILAALLVISEKVHAVSPEIVDHTMKNNRETIRPCIHIEQGSPQ
jgi:hypothetical protein